MKAQEIYIICTYADDGATVQDVVRSSFVTFLKKELEKFVSGASGCA